MLGISHDRLRRVRRAPLRTLLGLPLALTPVECEHPRAVWSLRLQAIFWHTILRRRFDDTRLRQWINADGRRGMAPNSEAGAWKYPFVFQRRLGCSLLMTVSPRLRSRTFNALRV